MSRAYQLNLKKPIFLAKLLGSCLLSSSLLSSCSYLAYQAKPLDSQAISSKLINKDPSSAEFSAYLTKQGHAQIPIEYWDLNALTDCALFFNSTLDLAKAKWAATQASINTAKQRQPLSVNGHLGQTNLKNRDISPWAFGLGVDIPIETANKREIRVEQASFEAEIAHIEIAQTTWQLRNQIAAQLVDYHQSLAQMALLQKDVDLQTAILSMLEKRFKLGMISSYEFNAAKLQQQKAINSLNAEQAHLPELQAKLATSVGLTSEKFNVLKLAPLNLDETLIQRSHYLTSVLAADKNSQSLQSMVLVNRLDIRASLMRYAVAETKLKLEIAKQHPDITLSPSVAFEFGDTIWLLGISSLLNLLNKNSGLHNSLIAEATSLREVEAAQFEELQAKVIGDLSVAQAGYAAANVEITKAQENVNLQSHQNLQLQKQFDKGLIDRLELTTSQLSTINAEQNLLNAKFKSLRAAYVIEDLAQHPLHNGFIKNNTAQENISHEP